MPATASASAAAATATAASVGAEGWRPGAAEASGAVIVCCDSRCLRAGFVADATPRAVVEVPADGSCGFLAPALWRELLEKRLGVDPQARPLVLALRSAASPARLREDACRLALTELRAPAVIAVSSDFCAVLGAGLSTALVVDVSGTEITVVPVDAGYPLVSCITQGAVEGDSLAADVPAGMAADASANAGAGGGADAASVAAAVAAAAADLVVDALRLQSDVHLRGRLLASILPVGDLRPSRLPGFSDLLLAGIRRQSGWVAPGTKLEDVRVLEPPGIDPELLSWRGGALLAQCDVARQLWISRGDFGAKGPAVVHRTFM